MTENLRPSPRPALAGPRPAAHPSARSLHWPLILGLGLVALARPLTNVVLDQLALEPGPVVPLGWTLLISLLWIAVVGVTRTPAPVLTLVLVGLVYAVAAIVLSGILSPLLLGHLAGPLTSPIAVIMVLATNACWGAVTGLLALALRRMRGVRPRGITPPPDTAGPR